MSRIFRWLAFAPLIVNLAVLAGVLGLVAFFHDPNRLDLFNSTFMFIGVFGGGQVARFISYQYFLRHPQPPKQSKEEIELLVATVMIQAREARARERILGSGAVTSTPYG